MATKKNHQAAAPPALRSRSELLDSSSALVMGQVQTEAQMEILRTTGDDLLRQRAFAVKELQAQQLTARSAQAAACNYVGLVSYSASLRTQVQGTPMAQKVDQFLTRLEEDHANTLLTIHYLAEERIQEIVAAPVNPPAGGEDEYIVEVPNLFKQVFGGKSTIKRVRR
jgi:hypothetical protein